MWVKKHFILQLHLDAPKVSGYSLLIGLNRRKKITPFFSRTFLQQLCTLPCNETTYSAPHPRLIWVHLPQPLWMFDMHLQHSQSGYLSVVSSLLEIGGSHRESGPVNMVSAAATAPHFYWKSQPLLLVCALMKTKKAKGHRVPSLGSTGTKLQRPLGDNDAHTSPQWLFICPQEEWWRHGPIFKRNRVIFWVWGEEARPGTAKLLTASWFPDHADRSMFHHLSALLRSVLDGLCWTFTTWTCTTQS